METCMNITARSVDPIGRTSVQIASSAPVAVVTLDVSGDLHISLVSPVATTPLSADMSGPVLICDPAYLKPRIKRRLRRLFMTLRAMNM
jgi:hypothetical protein